MPVMGMRCGGAAERIGSGVCSTSSHPAPIMRTQHSKSTRHASSTRCSTSAQQRPASASVITPPRQETYGLVAEKLLKLELALQPTPPTDVLATIMLPVQQDMITLNQNLRDVVGNRHPMLLAAADQIFGAGGKKLRPVILFLVARATAIQSGQSDINDRHRRLAEITEMIHTASLVHDDVLDECDTRRGKATINSVYGTRIAVLAGDFLFAQSSWGLANLDNLEVIKLISQVIADFANGEISQAQSLFDTEVTLPQYLDKSFYKTASLIAASCRSASVFSDSPEEVKLAMYNYGKHLGLAFQVVDDILDFTQTSEQLGKPQGQDLASGNLTAPVIFALSPELLAIIESEFVEDGSLEKAMQLVAAGGGIEASRALARQQGDLALGCLNVLVDSEPKRCLQLMVEHVLQRLY